VKVKANGTTLNYEVEGPEGARWLIVSHGIATSLRIWDEVSNHLKSKLRVLRYDSRGHGGSDAPKGDYSLEMLGEDAISLMDALGIQKAHYGGLSLGGMTAIGLALNHPQRLLSAICCDARASGTPEYVEGWKQRINDVRDKGMEAQVEPTVSRWLTKEFYADKSRTDPLRELIRKTPVDGYMGSGVALQGLNYGPRLGQIKVPMLYLTGAQDAGAPPAVMKEMAQQTPGAQYVEIPNAGHISTVEQPKLVAEAIDKFISGLGSRAA
jgi:3-oxoadipate enol-lactonase